MPALDQLSEVKAERQLGVRIAICGAKYTIGGSAEEPRQSWCQASDTLSYQMVSYRHSRIFSAQCGPDNRSYG